MQKVTKEAIHDLSQPQEDIVLSMYMPTHRHSAPPDLQENQTRFKNMLRRAREMVDEAGAGHHIKESLLKLEEQLGAKDAWANALESMAIFVSNSNVQLFHLPIECEESIYVNRSFNIAPLLVLESYNQAFYVLALAQHEPKLFKGDAYNIQLVDVDLPKSQNKALNIDEEFPGGHTKRSHQGGPDGASNTTTPHGEGDEDRSNAEDKRKFFRIIDDSIMKHSDFDETLPVLIAATENEAGDYLAHTKLPTVIRTFMKGNYTNIPLPEIHEHAWRIVHDAVVEVKDASLIERFHELKGAQKSSHKIAEIRQAAKEGRVETLLVNMIDSTRDSISETEVERAPVVRTATDISANDLMELISMVYQQGGRPVALDTASMPDGAPVAALYRY